MTQAPPPPRTTQQQQHGDDGETTVDPVTSRLTTAMQELAIKGELQRREKAEREERRRREEEEERERKELDELRKARLARMKAEVEKRAQDGLVRDIAQDDVLPTLLGNPRVVIHFYATGFETCALMNKRLETVARRHLETLFVKINSEKAPFFVDRFGVRTLPTLICFEDGKAVGKQIGFQGLDLKTNNEDEMIAGLERILDQIGVLDTSTKKENKHKSEDDD